MLYVGRRRYDGPGSLPCLIGKDAPFDAHRDGGADDTARYGIDAESIAHNGRKNSRDIMDMVAHYHQ